MERTKSPWQMHLQLSRIAKELRRLDVYKPYTAFLVQEKVHEIICRYIDNMHNAGINIDKSRYVGIKRSIYAGY